MRMLNPLRRSQARTENIEVVEKELADLKAQANAREPIVNALYRWATSARISNGVADDFYFDTSQPRQIRGKT